MDTIDELNKLGEFDYLTYVMTHQVVIKRLISIIKQVPHKISVNNCSVNYTCHRLSDSVDNQTYEIEYNGLTVLIEIPELDNIIDHSHTNALILFSFYDKNKIKRYINYTPYDLFKIIKEDDTIYTLIDRVVAKAFNWQIVEFNKEVTQVVTDTNIFDSLIDFDDDDFIVNKSDNFNHLVDD